ncbi:MAG: ABC transporter ATP-binding protein [Candidatus Choladocola sp.]|nr:ABC transporter ATP-binding protein [Candidatus Choladocola sp.]
MLKIENLVAKYGSIEALHGISLVVGEGEMVALIGANGAGKTTLLNSISGTLSTSGNIEFMQKEIGHMRAAQISRLGLIQVPEGRHVFPGLTVEENLLVGTVASKGMRLRPGDNSEDMEMVYEIFPRLKERRKQLAWSMSGGEQQMLAIGRALMGKPKLLMLDEPSMGLAPIVINELFEKIVEINRAGVPILMVEQNARLALKVSDRAYILERGNITAEGKSRELLHDPKVREAYLGKTVGASDNKNGTE